MDWTQLLNKQVSAPYIPIIDSNQDTKHFDPDICSIPVESPLVSSGNQNEQGDGFDGFSFEAKTLISSGEHTPAL